MTAADKAQMRLNCLYVAISIMGVNSSTLTKWEKDPGRRSTTEEVLVEAKKLTGWVLGKKGNDK